MPKHKRTKRVLLSALAVLVLLVIAWQFVKYRFVHRQIAQVVEEKTKGLYRLSYDQLVFDEVAGTLHVRNIDIQPDTAVYQQMVREKKEPHMLLQIRVDGLDIEGVKTPKALLAKELEGRKVQVTGVSVRIMTEHFKKDSSVYNPAPDLARQLVGKLLKIAIDSVQIKDATVVLGGMDSAETDFRGEKVSLLLTHFFVDSSARTDSNSILFSRGLTLDCGRLMLPSANKRYTIGVDSLRFTSIDNSVFVQRVKIAPRLSEEAFAASLPVQKDRYDFFLGKVSLRHIDRKMLWRKALRVDSLVVGESAFRIYRDISRPPDTTSKVGKYPQQQLMRLPFPLSIGEVSFKHSFIEYKEKNAKSGKAGKVQFYAVRATIHHVTNRREDMRKDDRCVVDFHARFLDKAPVNARLVLFLKDRRGRFTIDGRLEGISATDLNPLTEPMALTRLEKGEINHLQFSIRATDSAADATVQFAYDNLKVSMLKKDKDDAGYDKKGLTSLFANVLIKNSSRGKKAGPQAVYFQRILNKSMFNLIWKTLFAGIKKTAV